MKNTRPDISTNLKGIDLELQNISAIIKANLSWIDSTLGLAETIMRTDQDGKEETLPVVFVNNELNQQSCLPDDRWKAYCFWYVSDPAKVDGSLMIYDCSCVFFGNMKKIAHTDILHETKSKLREDVLEVFYRYLNAYNVDVKSVTDRTVGACFSDFKIDIDAKYLVYPYWALRVDCEVKFKSGHCSNNTYA